MSKVYGYCRCSTDENKQDISRQVRELKEMGAVPETIFTEYIDEKFLNEAIQENTFPSKKRKIKTISILGSTAACFCLVSGFLYFTIVPSKNLSIRGTMISYNDLNLYYEEQPLSKIDVFLLSNKKGEKITEFSNNDVNWYKMKNSDDIKTIIRDNGKEVNEWNFVNYNIKENSNLDIHWILENVFSLGSGNDIIDITLDNVKYTLDDEEKEKLYNDLLSLSYPHSDEDKIILEDMHERPELIKMTIHTKINSLNFVFYPDKKILKLDENGVYSLFTIISDNYFSNT